MSDFLTVPQWFYSGSRDLYELRTDPWGSGLARVKVFVEDGKETVWRVVDKNGNPIELGVYPTLAEAQHAVKAKR